jgi:hypothetical protein
LHALVYSSARSSGASPRCFSLAPKYIQSAH